MFLPVQTESFPAGNPSLKKVFLKSSPISKGSVVEMFSPFIELNELLRATRRTKQLEFIRNRRLTDEFLTTTLCLVEQSLNARPLVPASADATDLDVLTPNHFLLGTTGSSLPSTLSSDFDHRKRYARGQAYSDAIWSRWLRGYVSNLNRRHKWSPSADRDLKTGGLVWIVAATSPRKHYPLARVV